MHGVLATSVFLRQADVAGLTEDDIAAIETFLANNPLAGDLMVGTCGARKVRFAREGKGKSGGYRTIHDFAGGNVPIFLLGVINKSRTANLTQAERNDLAKVLPKIADAYRSGVVQLVSSRKR